MPITAAVATSLDQCSSSYTRDQATTLAPVYASGATHERFVAIAMLAASENAWTACDDGNECHSPSVENGSNRQASFVLSGRWRPTTGLSTPTMAFDTAYPADTRKTASARRRWCVSRAPR